MFKMMDPKKDNSWEKQMAEEFEKKGKTDATKFRRQAIYFLLAMVLIFSAIPWPWSAVARPWF